jgi:hypothetical protein
MMNCRLKLPCLANALAVTRFGSMPRGFAPRGGTVRADREAVAKWGNWHCGENKERFADTWTAGEATVVEDFIAGAATRVMVIGERVWQIALTGDTWRKSIHPDDAHFIDPDPRLVEDTRRLMAHFGLEVCGVDYVVTSEGTPHLLEVNHIPNVTRFEEIREAYLAFAATWVNAPSDTTGA